MTDLLSQDVPLEEVQYLDGHANPSTTQRLGPAAPTGDSEYRGEDFGIRLSGVTTLEVGGAVSTTSVAWRFIDALRHGGSST